MKGKSKKKASSVARDKAVASARMDLGEILDRVEAIQREAEQIKIAAKRSRMRLIDVEEVV